MTKRAGLMTGSFSKRSIAMNISLISAVNRPELLRPLFEAYAAMLYDVDEGMRACLKNQDYDEELS